MLTHSRLRSKILCKVYAFLLSYCTSDSTIRATHCKPDCFNRTFDCSVRVYLSTLYDRGIGRIGWACTLPITTLATPLTASTCKIIQFLLQKRYKWWQTPCLFQSLLYGAIGGVSVAAIHYASKS